MTFLPSVRGDGRIRRLVLRVRGWGGTLCVLGVVCTGLLQAQPAGGTMDEPVKEKARRLAHEFGIIDTHLDVPGRLHDTTDDVSGHTTEGDFDYPRAVEGGLRVAFMAVYIPSSLGETGTAKAYADTLIDLVTGLTVRWPDKFTIVRSPSAVRPGAGLQMALGMENGSGLDGDLANAGYFFDRGIRYITLAHAKSNEICDASYDTLRRWNGLSPFGADLVREMNRLGLMIDVSHISDSAFYGVIRLSRAPVIASHSSCRFFTPGFERNMSDEMIRALAAGGGVIQINFGSEFINNDVRLALAAEEQEMRTYLADHGLHRRDSAGAAYVRTYRAQHPAVLATVAEVAAHIDHVVKLVGIDYVGIGSDFDGLGDTLPVGLKDVSQYPNLIEQLLLLGYSDDDIHKICSGNLLRVWTAVEAAAGARAH